MSMTLGVLAGGKIFQYLLTRWKFSRTTARKIMATICELIYGYCRCSVDAARHVSNRPFNVSYILCITAIKNTSVNGTYLGDIISLEQSKTTHQ